MPGCGGGHDQCRRVRHPRRRRAHPEAAGGRAAWIEEQVGGKPYGVDLLLPPKYVGADSGGIDGKQARELLPEERRQFVDDLLVRYGIPVPTDEERQPVADLNISPKGYEPLLDVVFSHRIRLIASALGSPPAELVTRAHDSDVLVAALARRSHRHARQHAAAGVDLIVAQGTAKPAPAYRSGRDHGPRSRGGRRGGAGTGAGRRWNRPRPPESQQRWRWGPKSGWCGSVWLTTEEAETLPVVKDKFLAASSSDTVRSRSLTGKPARMLRPPGQQGDVIVINHRIARTAAIQASGMPHSA